MLIVMNSGGRLVNHRTEGRISVHALSGRINFRTAEQSVNLSVGQMLTLERELPHDVEAAVDSVFLLTIAWAGGPTVSNYSEHGGARRIRMMKPSSNASTSSELFLPSIVQCWFWNRMSTKLA